MKETSSHTSLKPFARFDPESQSWKTLPATGEGDSEPYSGVWPPWGSMRCGEACELPKPAHLTGGKGSSFLRGLLPTVAACDGVRGPDYARAARPDSGGDDLVTTVAKLLPTPRATDGSKGGAEPARHQRGPDVAVAVGAPGGARLMPTPAARDHKGIGRRGQLPNAVLPTPTAALATGGQRSRSGDRKEEKSLGGIAADAAIGVGWGKYEPAIRRWESLIGRPAPSPVEPARTGPRLSPRFVEWMMGLPEGLVADFGFSRKDAFRILGNGVVPQQAELAIRTLLGLAA